MSLPEFILKHYATLEKFTQKVTPFLAPVADTVDPKTEEKNAEGCASFFLQKCIAQVPKIATRFVSARLFFC